MGRFIDNAQQTIIDCVTVGQQFIEIHRAHDGTDIGHGEVQDCILQIGNLIGGLCCIEHLIEGHAIDADNGVIAGDDFLRWNVEHLFHHVKPCADTVEERHNEIEARHQRAGIAAKALHCVVVALRHSLYASKKRCKHKCG